MPSFDLTQMAVLAAISPAKAKNWTSERPFTIRASAHRASGRGSLNLYSIEDVYLMALASEFSKLGFAAKAIGKLVEKVQVKFKSLAECSSLTVWRTGETFRLAEGHDRPAKATLWVTVRTGELVQAVDQRAEKLD
jgi:hypothetical protein